MTTDPTAVTAVSAPGVAQPVDGPLASGLTRREHEMLDFERQWWRRAGAKDTAIRDRFGVPPTRYYQVLNTLVDRPAALAVDPLVIGRLRRLRAGRHPRRSAEVLSKRGSTV